MADKRTIKRSHDLDDPYLLARHPKTGAMRRFRSFKIYLFYSRAHHNHKTGHIYRTVNYGYAVSCRLDKDFTWYKMRHVPYE